MKKNYKKEKMEDERKRYTSERQRREAI
jgi:hypothetical protein